MATDSKKSRPIQGLILYGTSACHLCDIAEDLLSFHCASVGVITYDKCDISDSEDLFQRYGTRIPVLQCADGRELDWPFSTQELSRFLGG